LPVIETRFFGRSSHSLVWVTQLAIRETMQQGLLAYCFTVRISVLFGFPDKCKHLLLGIDYGHLRL